MPAPGMAPAKHRRWRHPMLWTWIASVGACLVFVALEGALAGRDVQSSLAQIRQPRWAAPMAVWIGLA
jgi:hypothetical protein